MLKLFKQLNKKRDKYKICLFLLFTYLSNLFKIKGVAINNAIVDGIVNHIAIGKSKTLSELIIVVIVNKQAISKIVYSTFF